VKSKIGERKSDKAKVASKRGGERVKLSGVKARER